MTDMPDTTLTPDPSHDAPGAQSDDAVGYSTPGDPISDPTAPQGPIAERCQTRKFEARLVNPSHRR